MTEQRVTTQPLRGWQVPAVEAPAADPAAGQWPPAPAQPPQAPVAPHQPPHRRRAAGLIAAVVAGLVLVLVIATAGFLAGRATNPSTQAQRSLGGAPVGSQAPAAAGSGVSSAQISSVTANVDPGIVDVNTVLGYQSGAAAGTGIVLSADGLVLTNNHVVSGATSISVTDVGNGQTYQASVLGYDRTGDIAVLQLSGAAGLSVAPLGDSSTVNTGDAVVAIGNAGGTGGTPRAVGGSASPPYQTITRHHASTGASEQLTGLIEVAAAIQPGDS